MPFYFIGVYNLSNWQFLILNILTHQYHVNVSNMALTLTFTNKETGLALTVMRGGLDHDVKQ